MTNHPVKAGDVLTATVPGAGGFGDPFVRDPERVAADVAAGLVTPGDARLSYGVAVDADSGAVDQAATEALRRA